MKPSVWNILIALLLTLFGSMAAHWVLSIPTSIGIDDANITMVYAKNISEGHGFVYTPGFERVEGSTSLLWTLISALAFSLSSRPEIIMLLVSGLACTATVFAVLEIARTLCPNESRRAIKISLVWLLIVPAFYAWNTITLMDLSVWTLLIHLTVWVLLKDVASPSVSVRATYALPILCATMVMARPEAMAVVPGMLTLAIFAIGTRVSAWRVAFLRYLPALISYVGALIALIAFRLAYFGYPLPNTFYAKVPQDFLYNAKKGLVYLLTFLHEIPLVLPLLVLAGFITLLYVYRALKRGFELPLAERGMIIVAGTVTMGMMLPIVGGGDHFGSHRFYQPFVPLMAVLVLHGLTRMWQISRHDNPALGIWGRRSLVLVGAITSSIFVWHSFYKNNGIRNEFQLANEGRFLGEVFNRTWPTTPRVAVTAAGGIAMTYQGRVVDLLGLNWAKMAHAPGDRKGMRNHASFNPEVFWTEIPEIVWPRIRQDRLAYPHHAYLHDESVILRGLFEDDRFRKLYVPGNLLTERGVMRMFVLRSWLDQYGQPHGWTELAWPSEGL